NADAHWIGVVRPPGGFTFVTNGGWGYIPNSGSYLRPGSRTFTMVDYNWANDKTSVRNLLAHELGHNLGRFHAPGWAAAAPAGAGDVVRRAGLLQSRVPHSGHLPRNGRLPRRCWQRPGRRGHAGADVVRAGNRSGPASAQWYRRRGAGRGGAERRRWRADAGR